MNENKNLIWIFVGVIAGLVAFAAFQAGRISVLRENKTLSPAVGVELKNPPPPPGSPPVVQ